MKSNAYVKKILDALPRGVEQALLVNESGSVKDFSFYYATQCKSGSFEGSALLVGKNPVIITSVLEEQAARESGLRVEVFSREKPFWKILQDNLSGKALGVNKACVSARFFQALQEKLKMAPVDVSKAVERAREVKTFEEVSKIRKACDIASKAAMEVPTFNFSKLTESQAAAELNYLMGSMGSPSQAFETIVAFGKNSALPHYTPSNFKAKTGDFLLFDFGASFNRYNSDVSRTFVYGKASKRHREVHDLVLRAQAAAIDSIRPGVKASEVDAAARKVIDSSTYNGRFIHSTGHSLGVEVHDGFGVSAGVDKVLEEGMVFTVEPGVYIKGFGGVRIEDDIVVTKTGCKVLTSAPRELLEL